MRLAYAALGALFLVAGCSTPTPGTVHGATEVPGNRMFFVDTPDSAPKATLVVVRDRKGGASVCYFNFSIDGKPAAQFDPNEKAVFQLAPGEHILGLAIQKTGLCGLGQDIVEREVHLAPGAEKYYRIFFTNERVLDIVPSAAVRGSSK